ncbi:uncharacterized protein LOC143427159 [Xylocopa sonorina]|uniref:uncharacterized protein LOC143427159 n=1 Tax=Xylocopa sonorina TaxID=1818115 RepID=UPI00403AE43F
MSVQNAIETFTSIMRSLNVDDQQMFLSFIADNWKPEEMKSRCLSQGDQKRCNLQQEQLNYIKQIVIDIRERVPLTGILPTEHIVPPTTGENSDCDDKSTKHVDGFLYDNNEVDELIEEGKLDNLYCANCGSNDVKEYNIISHSLSVSAMLHIFHNVLPSIEGKILLDVGSRLGAVLYGAYVFTSAKKIIGVEMNKELCTLQCDIVNKYNMNDRVEIVNKRIEECPDIVQKSDVIIMNNPFEFYVPELVHIEIWKFLKANIKSGTILVTRPPIETTFKSLETGISIKKWLKPYESKRTVRESNIFASTALDLSEHSDIEFYEVF